MQFLELFKKKGLVPSAYLVAGIILINAIILFYFNSLINGHEASIRRSKVIVVKAELLRKDAIAVDRAVKDHRVAPEGNPVSQYEAALTSLKKNLDSVRYYMKRQKFDESMLSRMESVVGEIVTAHEQYLGILQTGDSVQTIAGYSKIQNTVTPINDLVTELSTYIDEQLKDSRAEFAGLIRIGTVGQVLLLAGIPLLITLGLMVRSYRNKLVSMNREIDESNRKYVFDSLDKIDFDNEKDIKASLLNNLRKATDFIQSISNGNYDVRWEGMNDANRSVNQDNIAGELIRMREQMKQVKEEDRIRIWSTEGLSRFGEIIRKYQDNFEVLADSLISNVVKYIEAKMGGLFILEEDEEGRQYLRLISCYAYERKKYLTKHVDIGDGLIGQVYLEGQTIHLTEIPDEYVSITSGLGETRPSSLLVIPLKTNEKIEGVLEVASLRKFHPYEVEFLEKLGETLASSVVSMRTAERTKALLEKSQEQSEQMRAQEEEMRQNMEELEATQEQMTRQVNELNSLKGTLEKERYLFTALMDNMPETIYFKDKESKLIRVSKHMAQDFNLSTEELLGKSDFDFQDETHAWQAYNDEQQIMKTKQPKIDFIEKEIRSDGAEVWISTTKMPLVDLQGQVVGTFGISRNVSKMKKLEEELKAKEEELEKVKKG